MFFVSLFFQQLSCHNLQKQCFQVNLQIKKIQKSKTDTFFAPFCHSVCDKFTHFYLKIQIQM